MLVHRSAEAMSEVVTTDSATVERLLELGQKSSVKIDVNSKGFAQIKIAVYDGTSAEEMERLGKIAHKTFTDLQNSLGRIAKFT